VVRAEPVLTEVIVCCEGGCCNCRVGFSALLGLGNARGDKILADGTHTSGVKGVGRGAMSRL